MIKQTKYSYIVIAILLFIAGILFILAIDFFWRAMWQVHLDRQLIQYKVCQDYGCAR